MSNRRPATDSKRRGRPLELPQPALQSADPPRPDHRLAWLLVLNRVTDPDPRRTKRKHLVESFQGLGAKVDETRFSRWESGSQALPPTVLDIYEQVLRLPDRSLAALNSANLALDGQTPTTRHGDVEPVTEIDTLLERAGKGKLTGAGWFRLASEMTAYEYIYLRRTHWNSLLSRLINETSRSFGIAQLRRFEALRVLGGLPAAREQLFPLLCGTDRMPTPPGGAPITSLLAALDDRAAATASLGLLSRGNGTMSRQASWTIAIKLAKRQYASAELDQIVQHLNERIAGRGTSALAEPELLDVTTHLPEDRYQDVVAEIRSPGLRAQIEVARESYEILPTRIARDWVRDLTRPALNAVWGSEHDRIDRMLDRMVREALVHAHAERRRQAGVLLSMTPYRAALADQLCGTLRSPDARLAIRAAAALPHLITSEHFPLLLDYATDPSTGPGHVAARTHALMALAVVGLPDDPEVEQRLLQLAHDDRHPGIRSAIAYLIGSDPASDLQRVAERGDPDLAKAAEHWRAHGTRIADADLHEGHLVLLHPSAQDRSELPTK